MKSDGYLEQEKIRSSQKGTMWDSETFSHASGWKSKLAVAFAILFSVVVCSVFLL